MGGNIAARIITLVLLPIITRLYPAGVFGTFAMLVAVATVLGAVSTLRYPPAILLPRASSDADALTVLSIVISVVMASLVLAGMLLWETPLAAALGIPGQSGLLGYVPLLVVLLGVKSAVENRALRAGWVDTLARVEVAVSAVDRLVAITTALWFSANTMGLLNGRVTGLVSGLLALVVRYARQPAGLVPSSLTLGLLTRVAVRFRAFPRYAGSAMLQRGADEAPVLLLGALYSPAVAGYYALSGRVLSQPLQWLGMGIGRAYQHHAAVKLRGGEVLGSFTMELTRFLALLIVLPLWVLAVLAPDLFVWLFGAGWRDAGIYLRILSPLFGVMFVYMPVGTLFDLLEKQREQFRFAVALMLATLAALFTGVAWNLTPPETLTLYSAVLTFFWLGRLSWLVTAAGVPAPQLLLVLARILVLNLPFMSLFSGLVYWTPWLAVWGHILVGATCLAIYAGLLTYLEPRLRAVLAARPPH